MELLKLEIEYGTPEYHESIVLRDSILRKPLNIEFTAEQLALEYDSFHLGIYGNHSVLWGCLVLKPIDRFTIKMRQVAVEEKLQGKGIGQSLVKFSETFARDKEYSMMVLNARITAIPFYEKLGYEKEGGEFEEVGIPHYKMTKTL